MVFQSRRTEVWAYGRFLCPYLLQDGGRTLGFRHLLSFFALRVALVSKRSLSAFTQPVLLFQVIFLQYCLP